jgi:putative uncharacterized protein gp68|nr:MAG TPA: tail component [Caudoviricetes sp.]
MARGGESLEAFMRRCAEIEERLRRNQKAITRRVAMAVLSSVVQGTPIDTGRARSNWIVSISIRNPSFMPDAYVPGSHGSTTSQNTQMAINQGTAVINGYNVNGNGIYIQNNVPYIQTLNRVGGRVIGPLFVQKAVKDGIANVRNLGGRIISTDIP